MKKIDITGNEAGQRLDKFLKKYFREASPGFLYKMLRKKNITLNGHRAKGEERLTAGDEILVFFSDETFAKMKGTALPGPVPSQERGASPAAFSMAGHILYENADILIVNKPAGVLSQPGERGVASINDALLQYGMEQGFVTQESLHTFRPSAMHRLDRNTSGVLLCAKSYPGARYLDEAIRKNEIKKIYHCICLGRMSEEATWEDYLKKDASINRVEISGSRRAGFVPIKTGAAPLMTIREEALGEEISLVEAELFTGKSHQIRAHLAYQGYPVLGDGKYGDRRGNARIAKAYGIHRQLLHAQKIYLSDIGWVEAPYPEDFLTILPKLPSYFE